MEGRQPHLSGFAERLTRHRFNFFFLTLGGEGGGNSTWHVKGRVQGGHRGGGDLSPPHAHAPDSAKGGKVRGVKWDGVMDHGQFAAPWRGHLPYPRPQGTPCRHFGKEVTLSDGELPWHAWGTGDLSRVGR